MKFSQLISQVYDPPKLAHGMTVDSLYKDSYAFPFARLALYSGLVAFQLKRGDSILVPSLICRDVLAPLNSLGLNVHYYDVDLNLNMVPKISDLPKCKAIIAVHYFGLETDLTAYRQYCSLHQAVLVVDNAHGFLSLSQSGALLGAEGDFGIVSIRKTLPIEFGGLLLSSKKINVSHFKIKPLGLNFKVKNLLRPLVNVFGPGFLNIFVGIKRLLRFIIKGEKIQTSQVDDEHVMPETESISNFYEYFQKMDIKSEIERRRLLFLELVKRQKDYPWTPLKQKLSDGECPYGFPFYCEGKDIESVKNGLAKIDLEVMSWPALPEIIEKSAPDHYKKLYLVKFLW